MHVIKLEGRQHGHASGQWAGSPGQSPSQSGRGDRCAWVPDGAGIDELRKAASDCRGCELSEPATQVVFSAGNPRAPLALVGEAPGDVEDREGIPFVGPAGTLLQRALDQAGVPVADVYVTNAVRHSGSPSKGSAGSMRRRR